MALWFYLINFASYGENILLNFLYWRIIFMAVLSFNFNCFLTFPIKHPSESILSTVLQIFLFFSSKLGGEGCLTLLDYVLSRSRHWTILLFLILGKNSSISTMVPSSAAKTSSSGIMLSLVIWWVFKMIEIGMWFGIGTVMCILPSWLMWKARGWL